VEILSSGRSNPNRFNLAIKPIIVDFENVKIGLFDH
jgi:hypothetical protein